MNNKHLSWYKEINNNFIIASRAYFLQSPTCTRVNNLDYIVMLLTPMEPWCWSCFARERGLVNGSAIFRSVCILEISMSPSLTWSRMELKRLLMCLVLLWNLDSFAKAIAPENQAHKETLQFHPRSSQGGRHRDLQDTYGSECCRPVD